MNIANPIHGSSPKNPQQEIMVQGPQTKHVTELLLSQGVPKKYIEVVDKTGKGKKK
jgi:translation initiation factor 2D